MPTTKKIEFRVTITFDVDVKGDSSVYDEVTKLLESTNIHKHFKGSELPKNIYHGFISEDVTANNDLVADADLYLASDNISKKLYVLIRDFFNSKKLKHTIFVTVARRSTSAIRYTA